MGEQIARDIAAAPLGLRAKMEWHLVSNHYPPVNESFIPIAIEAIELARMGLWKHELSYPNGLTRSVLHTIEGLHLEAFLEENE